MISLHTHAHTLAHTHTHVHAHTHTHAHYLLWSSSLLSPVFFFPFLLHRPLLVSHSTPGPHSCNQLSQNVWRNKHNVAHGFVSTHTRSKDMAHYSFTIPWLNTNHTLRPATQPLSALSFSKSQAGELSPERHVKEGDLRLANVTLGNELTPRFQNVNSIQSYYLAWLLVHDQFLAVNSDAGTLPATLSCQLSGVSGFVLKSSYNYF